VTLRITIDHESRIQVVRLAGWLEAGVVAELERVVGEASGPLRLDLTELRSADQAGVICLRALHGRGASFVGASPFIRLLLGIETSRPPPRGEPKPREQEE
jgi:hypothetical protein